MGAAWHEDHPCRGGTAPRRQDSCRHAPRDWRGTLGERAYREIVPNERLVFTHAWEDDDGNRGPETLVRVEFEDAGPGKTRMIFRQTGFESVANRDGHQQGWSESFDDLAAYFTTL